MSTHVNTSTAIKSRQPQAKDEKLAQAINRIVSTGEVNEDYKQFDGWKRDALQELNDAALENRIDSALTSLTKLHPQIASYIAVEDQDQGEKLAPDTRIGKHGKPVYKTLTEDDIECFPDIEYMVSGLLQTSTVSLVFGESNAGKTFVALDFAEHVARGMNWQGRRVKQGPVLYIYAESRLGLKPRLQAWKKHHELPSTPNLQFITRPVQLVNDREILLETIAEQETIPALIVVDTFSNCSVGTNQNDQSEVYKVLATAHEIVREYGSHVMVVHHTNKQGLANGTAAFKNHVDTMIQLSRADKYAPVLIHCEKQRDSEQFNDFALQLQVVDLYINPTTLEPVSSCVVVASDIATPEKTLSLTQQKMIEILSLQGRTSYNAWKKACEDEKVAKPTAFYQHVQSLLAQEKVKKDSEGPGKKTWYEVVNETSSTSSQLVHSELVEVGTN